MTRGKPSTPQSEVPPPEYGGCHIDRPEIASEIAQLARIIAPGRIRRKLEVEISAQRSGRAVTTSQVINGRHMQVQRRRPFAFRE
jgi:hypothetical protein